MIYTDEYEQLLRKCSNSIESVADLRGATGGQAFPQCVFDHWQVMNGPATDESSKSGTIAKEVRIRKGLKETPPNLDDYMDVSDYLLSFFCLVARNYAVGGAPSSRRVSLRFFLLCLFL